MRVLTKIVLPFSLLIFISYSCRQDETLSPARGRATFSLSPKPRTNGRVNEAVVPAFVLLNIRDTKGVIQENIKLSLFSFGQSYLSENLELETGDYQLTQFAVLDISNKIVYFAPMKGSDMAKYVTNALPMGFTVTSEGTRITPQVLPVLDEDTPEIFGLASFGFEVVEMTTNLNITLRYPDPEAYDSVYIVFKNPETEIKQRLVMDNVSHIATGKVDGIPLGDWNISASYFSTIFKNSKSLEKNEVVDLRITSTATDIISDETVYVKDGSAPLKKSFVRTDYYYLQLILDQKNEGFVRLPKDPTNPFVEIFTRDPKWVYAYYDRSFYDKSLDGASNFYQGGGAGEVYGKNGDTQDRLDADIIDTTSLAPGIEEVNGHVWNFVDALILLYDNNDNNLLLYNEWDLRSPVVGGRINSGLSQPGWSKAEIERRKIIHLH